MEIEKRIESTTQYRKFGNRKIFNSDSSSLYGSSKEHLIPDLDKSKSEKKKFTA
jgi:hypothetical protein